MKKSLRKIGIVLIIISIIFALVNMGLLHFNYFTLLANGTAEFFHNSYTNDEVKTINVNMSGDVIDYTYSDDNKVHITYINSDKFFYEVQVKGTNVDVNLTDNIMWYDSFTFYMKIPVSIAIPKGSDIQVFENGNLVEKNKFEQTDSILGKNKKKTRAISEDMAL